MEPTFSHGDRLLTLRFWPWQWLKKGTIVVGMLPEVETSDRKDQTPLFVKRLIGMPGDTVRIHMSTLHEIMHDDLLDRCDQEGNLVWKVPKEHCFVKGDARLSGDSVSWGTIPLNLLQGIFLTKLPRSKKIPTQKYLEPPPHIKAKS